MHTQLKQRGFLRNCPRLNSFLLRKDRYRPPPQLLRFFPIEFIGRSLRLKLSLLYDQTSQSLNEELVLKAKTSSQPQEDAL